MMMGKVAGVPIRVHALLPMMALLSVALGQGQAMLMLSLAVLLHEVAHALAARLMKLYFCPLGARRGSNSFGRCVRPNRFWWRWPDRFAICCS